MKFYLCHSFFGLISKADILAGANKSRAGSNNINLGQLVVMGIGSFISIIFQQSITSVISSGHS